MQLVPRARHGDVEQAPLLLDFGTAAGGHVRRHAPVDQVEHEDRVPLAPLGRVDGGQDQVVLVEQRHAGLVASGLRRIERERRQELAPRVGRGDRVNWRMFSAMRPASSSSRCSCVSYQSAGQLEAAGQALWAAASAGPSTSSPQAFSRRPAGNAASAAAARRRRPRLEDLRPPSWGPPRPAAAARETPRPGRAGFAPSAAAPARP